MWLVFTLLAVLMLITSFRAIREVAVTVGAIDADLAWTIPLIYDALIIICSLAVNVLALWGRWHPFPLAVLTAATVLSTTANLAHAQGNSLLAHAIAATPPVGAFLTVELGAFLTRRVVAYWHLTPAHDTHPTPRTPTSASRQGRRHRPVRPAAFVTTVLGILTLAVALDRLSPWTAAVLAITALMATVTSWHRRRQARHPTQAAREMAAPVAPDPQANLTGHSLGKTATSRPPTRAAQGADLEQVWEQIASYTRGKGGPRPTQRELAAQLRRSRTSISNAIDAHRQEWNDLTSANTAASATQQPIDEEALV